MTIDALVSDEEVLDVLGKAYRGEYNARTYKSEEVKRVTEEIKRRENTESLAEILQEFFNSVGISHLDQIDSKLATKEGLWSILRIEKESDRHRIDEIQIELAKKAGFSPRLADYKNPEAIIAEIFERSIGDFNSFYFRESLHSKILWDNINLWFEHNEDLRNIKHLDQINSKLATKARFWSTIGIKKEKKSYNREEIKMGLFELGRFSPRLRKRFSPSLRDYENPEEIIAQIVERAKKPMSDSFYFRKSLDTEVLRDNIDLLFEYNEELRNIKHLDQIDSKLTQQMGLWSLVGIEKEEGKQYKIEEVQIGLFELGKFSPRLRKRFSPSLRDYENLEEIIAEIVENSERPGMFDSFYFRKSLDTEVLRDNIDLLFEYTEDLRNIMHLDQIDSKFTPKCGLWSLLGINRQELRHKIEELQKGFVKLGRFSEDLRTYSSSERELVFSDLLEKYLSSSYYLGGSHEYVESNRRLFFASEQFQDYLEREEISLDDLSTVRSRKAKSVFREYLGIDVGAVAGIEGTIIGTRKITSIWSEDEETRLLDNYRRIAGGLKNGQAIEAIEAEGVELEESFGRSIYAILMKLQHLGAIEFRDFGEPTGEPSNVILYPFPQFHERDLSGFSLRTKNSAYLLDLGMVPDATAVASYLSPTEQLVHATVPIHYKGIDLKNYNEAEQRLLGLVNTYIKHSDRFVGDTKKKSLELLADTELDKDIRILAVADEDNVYTQVMHRHEGVIPEEVAISTGKGSEIYFFRREETPTYAEARGWPAKVISHA